MKRLGFTLAATVLMAQANAWASPTSSDSGEAAARTLQFRPTGNASAPSARPAAASCTGKPTRMCVCYKLNCEGGTTQGALPPSPPPPPPPPAPYPQRSVEMPGRTAYAPVTQNQARVKAKRFRVRFVVAADMLPFQFDIAVSRHLALSLAFATFVAGENASYYLGGFLGLDYFPKGPAPKGLRFSVRGGRVIWGKKKVSDEKGSLNVLRLTVGYNWIWDNGFTLGLGFGKQLIHRGYRDSNRSMILFIPHMEFNLGVAF